MTASGHNEFYQPESIQPSLEGIILPSLDDSRLYEYTEWMAESGASVNSILDVIDYWHVNGILPSSAPSIPESRIEKSIHSNYEIHQIVDVKRRSKWVFNLVGNGDSYATKYDKDGRLVRAGCGFLYKDEGLGCLHAESHEDGKALVKLIAHTCMRPQCPVCYEKWAAREAYRINDRFKRVPKLPGTRTSEAEDRTVWGVPIHLMISVPELDAWLMDVTLGFSGIRKLRRKMARIAKRVGFLGGCAIFHPFSNEDEGEDESISVKIDAFSGEFDYKSLKEYFAKRNKDVKLWFIRPHFHLIGYGRIDGAEVAANYKENGWVVVNLGTRDSVMQTALYQLSHAGYLEGCQTITWMGCMSNRTFKDCNPLPKNTFKGRFCRYCGRVFVYVKWVGPGLSPLDTVKNAGEYKVEPPGWIEISKEEYRGRIVRPLPGERVR